MINVRVEISDSGCKINLPELKNKENYVVTWAAVGNIANELIGLKFAGVDADYKNGHPFPNLYVQFRKELIMSFQFDRNWKQGENEQRYPFEVTINGQKPACPPLVNPAIIIKK